MCPGFRHEVGEPTGIGDYSTFDWHPNSLTKRDTTMWKRFVSLILMFLEAK